MSGTTQSANTRLLLCFVSFTKPAFLQACFIWVHTFVPATAESPKLGTPRCLSFSATSAFTFEAMSVPIRP